MTPRPIPVMISCAQRETDRATTIANLARVGITNVAITISPCNPGTPAGTNTAARQAITRGMETHPRHPILFLEDDLDIAPDFMWHLHEAAAIDAPTYLYLNDTPERLARHHGATLAARILDGLPLEPGPRRLLTPAAPYGTQAVLLPTRLLEAIRALTEQPGPTPFDARLARYWRDTNEAIYTSLPHPVQHRNARIGKGPDWPTGDRRSLSYGLPRDWKNRAV